MKRGGAGLSLTDRACLMTEGASAEEVRWIDAWLRARPGRTLEDLKQQEDRLTAELQRYHTLVDDTVESHRVAFDQEERLSEAHKTAVAMLSQIDRDVLERSVAEISANEKMNPDHRNILLGLVKTALNYAHAER